nr:PREDICTED: uncharacterized protein LOC105673940 [Linepithema humile]
MTLTPVRPRGDLQPAITITMHRRVLRLNFRRQWLHGPVASCIALSFALKAETGLIRHGTHSSRRTECLTGARLSGPIRNINITDARGLKLREKLRMICSLDQSLFDNWIYAKWDSRYMHKSVLLLHKSVVNRHFEERDAKHYANDIMQKRSTFV